ncbi:hypothetical protein HYFRA_00002100 [Hymenoscyphus fraxineus]|uniref:Non-structural maintenance of chromosomes element 4 n=1 Tax=Hymenoscyphus fraxineus TaxID=746836 RepID=A0A9N9KNZ9_9HELO|nr:hypothetical protein HYFRA_00002100 [Hymenoscyphus fraxineus]
MGSRAKMSESPAMFEDDLYNATPEPPSRAQRRSNPMSPSPATSSDKENRTARQSLDKGKGRASMASERPLSPQSERNKRKRGITLESEGQASERERSRRRRTVERNDDSEDSDNYDPDQDIEERRVLRKGLRDLTKDLADNRTEWLAVGHHGLRDTMLKANELSHKVKQTADATIDARLLVNAAELSYKKTVALTSGDNAQGVDLEIFISKCRAFMRAAPADETAAPSNTQRRRGEAEEDDGEMLNWAYLGRHACIPNIARPAVPGFLLGPLSVEKRAKRTIVRKAALKISSIQESRPEVVESSNIEKSENANLTFLCKQILARAEEVRNQATSAVEAEWAEREENGNVSEEESRALMDRYGVSSEGGIEFFKFVINPRSFGQSVENMFYVSFLIRDGKAGISTDYRGLPYLNLTSSEVEDEDEDEDEEAAKRKKKDKDGPKKHQAVMSLDMGVWKEMIEIFDIKEPMIKHRKEEEHSSVGRRGWY